MAQIPGITECENTTNILTITGKAAVFQAIKMLGKGYFLITLIGVLSFTLLFFILWFM